MPVFSTTREEGRGGPDFAQYLCDSRRECGATCSRQGSDNSSKRKVLGPHLVVGVLGCMAERLKKESLLEQEKLVRSEWWDRTRIAISSPNLVEQVHGGQKAGERFAEPRRDVCGNQSGALGCQWCDSIYKHHARL